MTAILRPRSLTRAAAILILAMPGPRYGRAEEASKSGSSPPSVQYVAPPVDFPGRRIGAGMRGMGRFGTIQILAPDHLGYTVAEQPTLYWYLAEPTTTRIEFTLRDETSVEPLVDVALPAPAQAGIQAVRLSDFGAKLAAGTRYVWFVSLVADPEQRSKDFTSGAWIARRTPDAALRARLAASGASEASAYAEGGYWYDAIGALSKQITSAPADAQTHAQRAALLDQAGLSEVAAYDRQQAVNR